MTGFGHGGEEDEQPPDPPPSTPGPFDTEVVEEGEHDDA
jgi:hypothetical protein